MFDCRPHLLYFKLCSGKAAAAMIAPRKFRRILTLAAADDVHKL